MTSQFCDCGTYTGKTWLANIVIIYRTTIWIENETSSNNDNWVELPEKYICRSVCPATMFHFRRNMFVAKRMEMFFKKNKVNMINASMNF